MMDSNNKRKKLSIITVTLDSIEALEETLNSVRNQSSRNDVEFVVIDGGSKDGSQEFLKERRAEVDVLHSSADRGVYDAMNKGIQTSSGEWLYFLNAGDVFLNNDSVAKILDEMDGSDVLYSDVKVLKQDGSIYTFETSFDDCKLNHQGFVYRRHLHKKFGLYSVIKDFTAADYFFFLQLTDLKVKKMSAPLALFKSGGLSSTVNAVRQKYCLDFLAGKISALNLATRLVLYPIYRTLKNLTG